MGQGTILGSGFGLYGQAVDSILSSWHILTNGMQWFVLCLGLDPEKVGVLWTEN